MRWSLNFPPPTPSRCANRPKGTSVLPRLQNGCNRAPISVGRSVSAGAVFAHVLLQLLGGFVDADHHPFLESRQLQRTAAETPVLADPAALHVDRNAGHAVFSGAGISAGLLPVVLCRQA